MCLSLHLCFWLSHAADDCVQTMNDRPSKRTRSNTPMGGSKPPIDAPASTEAGSALGVLASGTAGSAIADKSNDAAIASAMFGLADVYEFDHSDEDVPTDDDQDWDPTPKPKTNPPTVNKKFQPAPSAARAADRTASAKEREVKGTCHTTHPPNYITSFAIGFDPKSSSLCLGHPLVHTQSGRYQRITSRRHALVQVNSIQFYRTLLQNERNKFGFIKTGIFCDRSSVMILRSVQRKEVPFRPTDFTPKSTGRRAPFSKNSSVQMSWIY